MPKGTPKYFEQIDPYGGRISVDDPEFAAKVRAKIGAPYKDLVDPSKAQNALDELIPFMRSDQYGRVRSAPERGKYSLLGIHYNDNTSPADRVKNAKSMGLGAIDPSKPVVGIGAGASPQTFAHEFRHGKVHDEEQNRLEDLLHANSQPQYVRAIQSAYEHLTGEKGEHMPIDKKEAYVLRMYGDSLPQGVDINSHAAINNGTSEQSKSLFGKTIDLGYPRGSVNKDTIKHRAQYPFLNWVGMSELPDPSKYKAGGNIENTTHDRKLI